MTTVDELFNSGRTLSQDEVDALIKFCGENNLAVDGISGANNGKELAVYIVDTWGQRITPATLAVALEKLKDHLTFLSQAESQYNRVTAENPAAAATLWNWFANQKLLVNTGDEGFQNASNILQELRGHAVTSETIQNAIARIGAPVSRFHEARRPLHYVQAPRRTEPQSAAAKADNSTSSNWLGRDMVKNADGSYRSKTVAEQRSDREAAERANSQSQTPSPLSETDQAWKRMADELLADGTHSQQQRVRAVYDREEAQGSSWRRIFEACKREVNAYKNRGIR